MKARSLHPGDMVGIINTASATIEPDDLDAVERVMKTFDLRVKRGEHVLDRHGYLAGSDRARADDLNRMFQDDDVQMILAIRGGWGSARILDLIDFDAISTRPKVFLGFSDLTALHLALHARTGLITFHGPNGVSRWSRFTADHFRRLLLDAETPLLQNPEPVATERDISPRDHGWRTVRGGVARGRLLGGNLTILTSLIGSTYLPSFDGAILFLEDVAEEPYRIDRMLTQLRLAGILSRVSGVAVGHFTRCVPSSGYGSFSVNELLDHYLRPLGIPAFAGAMVGHIPDQFTLPVGLDVELDADAGTLRLLEPAVDVE